MLAPSTPADPLRERFIGDMRTNACNRAILERWNDLGLRDGWLVAGCLFQTVWNLRSGNAPQAHIKDYDLFYFDAADLTEEAERRVQARVEAATADLGIVVEAKNQARVHLWYREHFGYEYPQLRSACDGIDRFLVPATCVGVRPARAHCDVYAPYGLALLYEGLLAPNPLTDHRDLFHAKAASYRRRWPWLRIEPAPLGAT
jgi:uncharacterized protein